MMNKLKYVLFAVLVALIPAAVSAENISDADLESGDFSSWNIGSQTGSLSAIITGSGTGVSIINSEVTFSADSHPSVGSPTSPDGSDNPYYQPAVDAAVWKFSPYGTYAAALQPNGQSTFDSAITNLGLAESDGVDLKSMMASQAASSGYGSGTPTDAAWITKNVTLSAGVTYTMSWNYIGTDYVPFNDGSITSLAYLGSEADVTISVNNGNTNYALLGFTNPGTGDYSTGTFGSTGWQVSTYEVSADGEYLVGFAVFNLDDTALSPVLLVDSQPGGTVKNDEPFGAVAPNNPDAPTVAPTTEAPTTTIEETTTTVEETTTTIEDTTTTEAPVTEPPVVETTTTAPEISYTPPVYVPKTTTSTTTEVSTTTSVPVVDTPVETTLPIENEIVNLPKTGHASLNVFIIGILFVSIGLFILFGRATTEDSLRRKI